MIHSIIYIYVFFLYVFWQQSDRINCRTCTSFSSTTWEAGRLHHWSMGKLPGPELPSVHSGILYINAEVWEILAGGYSICPFHRVGLSMFSPTFNQKSRFCFYSETKKTFWNSRDSNPRPWALAKLARRITSALDHHGPLSEVFVFMVVKGFYGYYVIQSSTPPPPKKK